jgi:hypothetical protein
MRPTGPKDLGTGEDPLGVVGVQPHPFPIARRERAWFDPDSGRNRDIAEIVDERRAAQHCNIAVRQAARTAGRFCKRGYGA